MKFKRAFFQYVRLLKASYLNQRGDRRKRREEAVSKRKGLGKVGFAILYAFGGLAILGFEFSIASQLAMAAVRANAVENTLYVLVGITQLVVLFFGILTSMGYLYFSKDQKLLSTLPFEKGVVFAVKSTQAYLGELLINCIVFIPIAVAYGIICNVYGYALPWTYYLVAVLAAFMTPAVPMLLITLLSLPIMRLVAIFKRRRVGNGIALAVLYLLFMAGYLALVGVGSAGEITLGEGALTAFDNVRKATIFNYPIVNAMLGNNGWANFFIYFAGIMVLFAANLLFSLLFYNKILRDSEESGGEVVRKKSRSTAPKSVFSSFFLKELKTLVSTPTILMSVILGLVMPVLIMAFYKFTFSDISTAEDPVPWMIGNLDMFSVGLATFIVQLMSVSAGSVTSVGFSLEGKNLPMLKSLPLSPRELVKIKLSFSMVITGIQSILVLIAFPLTMGIHNPIAIIGLPLMVALSGFFSNSMMLYFDLKDPNYTWNNISEITKNNKRMIKPMMIVMAVAFAYFIIAVILGVAGKTLSATAALAIYYGSAIALLGVFSWLSYRKLMERPEYYFAAIGG